MASANELSLGSADMLHQSGIEHAQIMGVVEFRKDINLGQATVGEIQSTNPDRVKSGSEPIGPYLHMAEPDFSATLRSHEGMVQATAQTGKGETDPALQEAITRAEQEARAEVMAQYHAQQEREELHKTRVASLPEEFHKMAKQLAQVEAGGNHTEFDRKLQETVGAMPDPDHWKTAELVSEINENLPPGQRIALSNNSSRTFGGEPAKIMGYVDLRTPAEKAAERAKTEYDVRHETGDPKDPDSWTKTPGTNVFSIASQPDPYLTRLAEQSRTRLGYEEETWYGPKDPHSLDPYHLLNHRPR